VEKANNDKEVKAGIIPAPQQEIVKALIKKVAATPLPVKNADKKARRKIPIWIL